MTKIAGTLAITIYQLIISPFLKSVTGSSRLCRFEETCSAYTKRQIQEKGLLRGCALGFVRILKCQPFNLSL